jgi:hypothetical protein
MFSYTGENLEIKISMKKPLTYQIVDKNICRKCAKTVEKSAKTWMCVCWQIEPKTQSMYSLHSSLVEHQLPARVGGCSSPGKNNIFKLGLPSSQDENAAGLELAGHLEK